MNQVKGSDNQDNLIISVDFSVLLNWFSNAFKKCIRLPFQSYLFLLVIIMFNYWLYGQWQLNQQEKVATQTYVSKPKIDDIYFLDFTKITSELRPNQRYRVAKIFDITGDVVSLKYSDLLFEHKHSASSSIRLGQLRYSHYFQSQPINFTLEQLSNMLKSGAIYLVKRPQKGKLYDNFIAPDKPFYSSNKYIPGRVEFNQGKAHFNNYLDELNHLQAFDAFERSATLGFAEGQIKLAEMYLNGWQVEQDKMRALYWLKQASLQSSKTAILKYGIVCQSVSGCNVIDFYQDLIDSGVNLKVRSIKNNAILD